MSSEITCRVSHCDYFKNMKCAADKVEVNMQGRAAENCSSDSTYCETFKSKKC